MNTGGGDRSNNSLGRVLVVVFLCFVASFLGSWIFLSSGLINLENTVKTTTKIVSSEENATSEVASKVSPSVVSVTTTMVSTNGYYNTTSQGAGTGVILSKDGYIMTNKHVVDGAAQVAIVTDSGEVYKDVNVVGTDPLNDIAFLKVKSPSNFVPAKLVDSSKVKVGQKVLAIGNALGEYQNSVTSGIVSGLGRPIKADNGSADGESLENLLQIDAAINPGNSGGPLVDLNGQVIGINTAIAADAEGIGFAIPVNAAKGLIKGLVKNGKVERAYLGVMYIGITPGVADQLGLPVKEGAYISNDSQDTVVSGSPADKSGLRPGDIIRTVDGAEVTQSSGLSLLLAVYTPGDEVTLGVLRDGKNIDIKVKLDAYTVE